jgi:hypothetical protein
MKSIPTHNSNGYGRYQNTVGKSDEWLTPPEIIQALGEFDLDPCSPVNRPWPTAKNHFTVFDNGLLQTWFGRVWLNPPYGSIMYEWMKKLADHGNGIGLIFTRTSVPRFHQHIFSRTDCMLFVEKRIPFYNIHGLIPLDKRGRKSQATAPSVLCAFGKYNVQALHDANNSKKIPGTIMYPAGRTPVIIIGFSAAWKSVVSIVLSRLGGSADLQTIYNWVETVAPDKVKNNQYFREKVRQTLQKHFLKINRGVYSNTIS